MFRTAAIPALAAFFFVFTLTACKHEPEPGNSGYGSYPPEVGKIIVDRCATAGCHNEASYINSDGLLLNTWDHLFDGGVNGATVVPYDLENSSLLYFINTDSSLGLAQPPTMPYNQAPLSKEEYLTIRNWVANGAPDANGNIPFAANPENRQKIYLTMQGCDLVAVIDADRKVVMRYIHVGKSSAIESPHCVRVSPDGRYAYVSFLAGDYIQKIDTRTDEIVGEINVGAVAPDGSWNVVNISPDGHKFIVSDWTGNGQVLLINADSMKVIQQFSGSGLFVYPHASAANPTFDTFFVTAQYGNVVYKLSPNGSYYKKVVIDGNPASYQSGTRDPHEIMMTPDRSRYFLTCQASNEVRVMDAHTDALLKVIPVGIYPQDMAISSTKPYIFVTCMEDNNANGTSYKGSVYVIDYNSMSVVQRIDGKFYQPHGVTVDDRNGIFYIASTNANPNGPAPHHVSSCGGRNGWYNVYDLNTLQPYDSKRYEVSVDPYSADTRFK